MSKFYIGVDLEGVACAVGIPGEGMGSGANYVFAAREALREANACARALFDCGADEVIVWDNHGAGVNLDYDEVDPRCRIALGSGFHTRFPGIDSSFGGVLFIGYHAREGTGRAVLAHTYSSKVYQRYTVNGQEMGEMDIDAAYAGEHGVPVLFCASDAACVAQAKERFPWAEMVVTKEGWGWNAAISLHPREAQKRIYEAVRRAMARLDEMQPYRIPGPFEFSVRFKRMDAAAQAPLYDRERRPFACPDPFTRAGRLDRISQVID